MLLQFQRLIRLLIPESTLKLVRVKTLAYMQNNNHVGVMPKNVSMLITNGNTSKSSSAVSLLSAEAEQALLKVIINNVVVNNASYCNHSNKKNI